MHADPRRIHLYDAGLTLGKTRLAIAAVFGLFVEIAAACSGSRGPSREPSRELSSVIDNAIQTATLTLRRDELVTPFSITFGGAGNPPKVTDYAEAKTIGFKKTEALDYPKSVAAGRTRLASEDDRLAVFVRSVRDKVGGETFDAFAIEAYERGEPVTYRFVQDYEIDAGTRKVRLQGKLARLSDAPPHFATPPPN